MDNKSAWKSRKNLCVKVERNLQVDTAVAEAEPKKPPASAVDLPKRLELSTPLGGARLTLFRTL